MNYLDIVKRNTENSKKSNQDEWSVSFTIDGRHVMDWWPVYGDEPFILEVIESIKEHFKNRVSSIQYHIGA